VGCRQNVTRHCRSCACFNEDQAVSRRTWSKAPLSGRAIF
jgi:hypothetical protein